MLKFILLGLILTSCLAIGVGLSSFYKKRNSFYGDVILFCEQLLNEVNFMHTKLKDMTEKSIDRYGKSFNSLLLEYKKYLSSEIDFELFKFKCNIFLNFLKEHEKQLLYDFLKTVGGLDVENEVVNIKNYLILFKQVRENTEKDQKKYCGLYTKMGFIAGIALIIILV